MFINRAKNGKNNLCGERVYILRKGMKISQRGLADLLQLQGLDVDKNAIQRIESGQRFVTDIELLSLSKVFNVAIDELIIYD